MDSAIGTCRAGPSWGMLLHLIAPRKPGIAFTLGAMGSRAHNFYNAAYQRAGYEELARRAQRLWLDGRRDEAAALIPDEVVLRTNLLGADVMVRERIRVYRAAGVTTLRVAPEGKTLAERLETLARFVDLVKQVDAEPITATRGSDSSRGRPAPA